MLIVGLGNPGSEYKNNRHNVGFMAVEAICQKFGFPPAQSKFKGEFCAGEIAGQKVYVIKPSTFMNKSGVSVAQVANFYKIASEDIYVFYDELDVPVGKLKVKTGGGAGGHNGIKSLDAHISKEYHRIRIGIDHPGHKDKVHKYVLGDFKAKERTEIDILLGHITDHVDVLLTQKNSNFTTKLALAMNPPEVKKEIKDDTSSRGLTTGSRNTTLGTAIK